MFEEKFNVSPEGGITFVDHSKNDRTGHMGHALVEYGEGKILAFYPNCSSEDKRWNGHSGYGWMEYKRSEDYGKTWSEPIAEPHSKALFDSNCGKTHACEFAVCTSSKRIVLFYLTCDMVVNGHIWEPYHPPFVAFSDDGGVTWSEKRELIHECGRVIDARYEDGTIFVLFDANPELPGLARIVEHKYYLLTSDDNGESFTIRSIIPFNSTKYTYYGNICFTPSGDIYAYCYDECDENNLKMVVSKDKGYSWGKQHRVYFENRIRNPQICYFGGKYLAHGRSGSMGPNPGHFILYCSDDGVNWDEGRILRKCEHGAGAYSNKLIVHNPSGKDRLMILSSHAYEKNKTNTIMFWVDEK